MKINLFSLGVFPGEQFTGKWLFDTCYKMAIQVQNLMLKVNYFLLKNPKFVMGGNRGSNRHDICGSLMIIHDDDDEGAKQDTKF